MIITIFLVYTSLCGCVKRKMFITSNPDGALVWINDREVGRTPSEVEFLYYGEYDLRLEKDGFEPIMTTRWAELPLWEFPVVDLVAEVIAPNRESHVRWHFELEQRNDDPLKLIERAKIMRGAVREVQDE